MADPKAGDYVRVLAPVPGLPVSDARRLYGGRYAKVLATRTTGLGAEVYVDADQGMPARQSIVFRSWMPVADVEVVAKPRPQDLA